MSLILKHLFYNNSLIDITIEGKYISKISPSDTVIFEESGNEIIDFKGFAVVPGFINCHTHSAMTLLRGICEDKRLEEWLQNIWAMEAKIDEEFIYWGTKIACLEMIKSGTTTFNDQYFFPSTAQKASSEMGLHSFICNVILDNFNKEKIVKEREDTLKLYEESSSWEDLSHFSGAFHAVYTVSEENILWLSDFCQKHSLNLHIHLSETRAEVENCKKAHNGLSPVEYLESLGVLNERVIAAHCMNLSEKDIEILGKRKVNCVHNINSNLKLASGYNFKYEELKKAGANVCIGTDGCASSNNLDMLEAMKTTSLVQKGVCYDPTCLCAEETLDLGTKNGAKALGLNSGQIREGCIADLNIINTNSTHFLSPAPIENNLLFSAHSDCIDSVMSNGKFLMKNKKIKDEQYILDEAKKYISRIIK